MSRPVEGYRHSYVCNPAILRRAKRSGSDGDAVVSVFVRDLCIRIARLQQVISEILSSGQIILALVTRPVHPKEWDADGPVVEKLDRLLEERPESIRIAVRGEAHNLVFVGIEIETQMKRDHRIEYADGIARRYFAESVQSAIVSMICGCALELPHAVDNQH